MNKIVKYGLIILKNDSFLINRKHGTNLFLMPGGKPEANETIEKCLVREIKEEHECDLIPETIRYFGQFEDLAANEPNTIISMQVYLGEVKQDPLPNSEIAEQRWFTKSDNPEILSPIIKNKILPEIIKNNLI